MSKKSDYVDGAFVELYYDIGRLAYHVGETLGDLQTRLNNQVGSNSYYSALLGYKDEKAKTLKCNQPEEIDPYDIILNKINNWGFKDQAIQDKLIKDYGYNPSFEFIDHIPGLYRHPGSPFDSFVVQMYYLLGLPEYDFKFEDFKEELENLN